MSLEEQAASRKERLAQLRNLKRKSDNEGGSTEETAGSTQVSGRNFDLETKGPKMGYEQRPLDSIDDTVEIVAEKAKQETIDDLNSRTSGGLDLTSLQPKSINWDLKRELEPKLKVLDARTDNAILKLVHDRIKGQVEKTED